MIQKICRTLLYSWMGFSTDFTEEKPNKFILALAPHTSNWDFIVGLLYSYAEDFHCNFLMKKEWFFWPIGSFMRSIGGIPVYRDKKMNTTDVIANQARQMPKFRICITPEGTRSANPEWKRGFYYIALKANLPILLCGLDYKQKKIICHRTFVPTGDIDKEMNEIKEYFSQFKGKHPHKFAI